MVSDREGTTFRGVLDARRRVTGDMGFTVDLEVPGMLHAALLRSDVPHAVIRHVDASRARRIRGVRAVLTGADLLAQDRLFPYFGPVFRDQGIVALDKVRYIGDPVAAVAADDLDTAREAVDALTVEYERLPGVFDVDAALRDDAPILHEGPPRTGHTYADVIVKPRAGTNVCNVFNLVQGDVDRGFAQSAHVFEDQFSCPPVQHVPLETHVCVAHVANGRITVWTATQTPFSIRAQLSEIFKVPQSQVRVIAPALGGGYGAKCYPKIEPVTAVLSQMTRRPVKLHLTREEEFKTITKHGATITMTTGLSRDGSILARRSRCLFNTGAYADTGPRVIKKGGYGTGGPYFIPNIVAESLAVYTNLPPAGAFRGYGINQAAWAYETQMDMIAERLGMDPFELRMRNLLRDGQPVATGEPMTDSHLHELLRDATNWIGWDPNEVPRPEGGKVRAKGFSCITKSTVTPSTSTAVVKLNEDGSLDVLTSSVEMGQGMHTAMAILAAEPLGIDPERVHVSTVDTDVTPYDQQSSSSRSTYSMGTAVTRAVEEIRSRVLLEAAALTGHSAETLTVRGGHVVSTDVPELCLPLGEVVRRSRSGNVLGEATYRTEGGLDPQTGQGVGSVHWYQGVGAVEVEVDLETGVVTLLRYHAGLYAGRMVNPTTVALQTEGNVAFGVGQALFEEMVFDNGQLVNGSLADYMIASAADMPKELHMSVLEHPSRDVIHGVGETTLPPVMPAIGNAVARATGVRILDLPITAEKVLRGLVQLRRPDPDEQSEKVATDEAVTSADAGDPEPIGGRAR